MSTFEFRAEKCSTLLTHFGAKFKCGHLDDALLETLYLVHALGIYVISDNVGLNRLHSSLGLDRVWNSGTQSRPRQVKFTPRIYNWNPYLTAILRAVGCV